MVKNRRRDTGDIIPPGRKSKSSARARNRGNTFSMKSFGSLPVRRDRSFIIKPEKENEDLFCQQIYDESVVDQDLKREMRGGRQMGRKEGEIVLYTPDQIETYKSQWVRYERSSELTPAVIDEINQDGDIAQIFLFKTCNNDRGFWTVTRIVGQGEEPVPIQFEGGQCPNLSYMILFTIILYNIDYLYDFYDSLNTTRTEVRLLGPFFGPISPFYITTIPASSEFSVDRIQIRFEHHGLDNGSPRSETPIVRVVREIRADIFELRGVFVDQLYTYNGEEDNCGSFSNATIVYLPPPYWTTIKKFLYRIWITGYYYNWLLHTIEPRVHAPTPNALPVEIKNWTQYPISTVENPFAYIEPKIEYMLLYVMTDETDLEEPNVLYECFGYRVGYDEDLEPKTRHSYLEGNLSLGFIFDEDTGEWARGTNYSWYDPEIHYVDGYLFDPNGYVRLKVIASRIGPDCARFVRDSPNDPWVEVPRGDRFLVPPANSYDYNNGITIRPNPKTGGWTRVPGPVDPKLNPSMYQGNGITGILSHFQRDSKYDDVFIPSYSYPGTIPGQPGGGSGGGGGGGGGLEEEWECDCPDFTKREKGSTKAIYRSKRISRDWSASNAGADGDCKHIYAAKRAIGAPIDVPTDIPTKPPSKSRLRGKRDPFSRWGR